MDIDIRKSIISNFEKSSEEEIIESIEKACKSEEEITLPGLGVFFEIVWNNCNSEFKSSIIDIIKDYIKKL